MTAGIDISHEYGGTVNSMSLLWIWIRYFCAKSDSEYCTHKYSRGSATQNQPTFAGKEPRALS
jgi:hypothetical protein